jgi:hypothetical protein
MSSIRERVRLVQQSNRRKSSEVSISSLSRSTPSSTPEPQQAEQLHVVVARLLMACRAFRTALMSTKIPRVLSHANDIRIEVSRCRQLVKKACDSSSEKRSRSLSKHQTDGIEAQLKTLDSVIYAFSTLRYMDVGIVAQRIELCELWIEQFLHRISPDIPQLKKMAKPKVEKPLKVKKVKPIEVFVQTKSSTQAPLKNPISVGGVARVLGLPRTQILRQLQRSALPIVGTEENPVAELEHIAACVGNKREFLMAWAAKERLINKGNQVMS